MLTQLAFPNCRAVAPKVAGARVSRRVCRVYASAVATKTVKIGTRGSPLALAQAYMTRDLLKVRAISDGPDIYSLSSLH